jgi:DNA-binding protein YbaB
VEFTPETSAVLCAEMEEALARYEQLRDAVGELRRKAAETTAEAHTDDGLVKVELNARGTLTGLHIDARAYRKYPPTLLAETILDLVRQATVTATKDIGELMKPVLPDGVTYEQLLTGAVGPFGRPRPRAATEMLREILGDGADRR